MVETLIDKQVDGDLTCKQVKDKIGETKVGKDFLEVVIKIEAKVITDSKTHQPLLNLVHNLIQVLGVPQVLQLLQVLKEEVAIRDQLGVLADLNKTIMVRVINFKE